MPKVMFTGLFKQRFPRQIHVSKISLKRFSGRRCLDCWAALPSHSRKDKRFCCRRCANAFWRRYGPMRAIEARVGADRLHEMFVERAVLDPHVFIESPPPRRRKAAKAANVLANCGHGKGANYKPMPLKWKPAPRDYSASPAGSFWTLRHRRRCGRVRATRAEPVENLDPGDGRLDRRNIDLVVSVMQGLIGFVQRPATLLTLFGHHPDDLVGVFCQRSVLALAPEAAPPGSGLSPLPLLALALKSFDGGTLELLEFFGGLPS
jgi:hypothetical protein